MSVRYLPSLSLPVHGWLTGPRIDLLFITALLPPLGQSLYAHGTTMLPVLATNLLIAFGWEAVFAAVRKRAAGFSPAIPAIAFALLVPSSAPLWQIALGLSFGVVVGVHVFGGYGWNFLNPVAAALVFLFFSFPGAGYTTVPTVPWEACLPGAILLLATGVISWRVLVAASLALFGGIELMLGGSVQPLEALAGFLFVLIFLACDPVASPATIGGRWFYALLIGLLAALGLASGKPQMEVFGSTILLGGIFTPLIDYGVSRFQVRYRRGQRERNHG